MDALPSTAPSSAAPASDEPVLPPLTASERRIYDKLAVGMQRFHDHFRREFNEIYNFADKPERLAMSLPAFLNFASGLSHHLHMHHQIEECALRAQLGQRIPAFNEAENGDRALAHHLRLLMLQTSVALASDGLTVQCLQHQQIHDGLDRYDAALADFRKAPSTYSPAQLRAVMDSFRDVLFLHLDEEVKTLGADSIRRYYTLDEMKAMYL